MDRFTIDKYTPVLKCICTPISKAGLKYMTTPVNNIKLGIWCIFDDEDIDNAFDTAYASRYNLSYNHDDISQIKILLSNNCINSTEDSWDFNGFSISQYNTKSKVHKGLWRYQYHPHITSFIETNDNNLISGNDVLRLMEMDRTNLLEKPLSMIKLEKLLGVKATRHRYCFGQWSIIKPGVISIYCNPCGLDNGLSDSADNFTVLNLITNAEFGYKSYEDVAVMFVEAMLVGSSQLFSNLHNIIANGL